MVTGGVVKGLHFAQEDAPIEIANICKTFILKTITKKRKRKKSKEVIHHVAKKHKNKTGFFGITKNGDRYQGIICINGTSKYLGRFDTAKEAAVAYDNAAVSIGRPISSLNFPKNVPENYVPAKMNPSKKTNMVGYRGVSKNYQRYRADIFIDGKRIYLGTFDNAIDAAMAYDTASIEVGRERVLNFPK